MAGLLAFLRLLHEVGVLVLAALLTALALLRLALLGLAILRLLLTLLVLALLATGLALAALVLHVVELFDQLLDAILHRGAALSGLLEQLLWLVALLAFAAGLAQ